MIFVCHLPDHMHRDPSESIWRLRAPSGLHSERFFDQILKNKIIWFIMRPTPANQLSIGGFLLTWIRQSNYHARAIEINHKARVVMKKNRTRLKNQWLPTGTCVWSWIQHDCGVSLSTQIMMVLVGVEGPSHWC